MKEIKLTQGLSTLVDDEDYESVSQHKWFAVKDGRTYYACKNAGILPFRYRLWMHRVILSAPKELQVDHINGNGLDNRRCNLRLVTGAQNSTNSQKKSGSTSSRFKGVDWYKPYDKWRARITNNRRVTHLGYFNTDIEAAQAYNEAAIELFGEFARLNDLSTE